MASSARRRMREGFAAGQIPLDGFDVLSTPVAATDEDAQAAFAVHVAALERAYAARDNDAWAGSPYAWIRNLAPGRRGKVGEELVDRWLRAAGVDVSPRVNAEHDRIVAGRKVEVKLSTLWTGGEYTFQQLRDQDYDLLVLLGVSPNRVHLWVVPKVIALTEVSRQQAAGGAGGDTRWLSFPAAAPPVWLAPFGGTLPDAFASLARRTSGSAA